MTTGVKRQELLDAFEANELSYDLWDSIEELEKVAGPQENFRRVAREFFKATRRRILDLVRRAIGDEQVQSRISYVLRLTNDALHQSRECCKAKFPSQAAEADSMERDLAAFEKYLNDFTRDIGNLAVDEWRRKSVEECERHARPRESEN